MKSSHHCDALIKHLGLAGPAAMFAELHPGLQYLLVLLDGLPAGREAVTTFDTVDGVPEIGLLRDRALDDQRRLFIHELAHVVAGLKAGHGDAWQEAETELHVAVAAAALRGS